MAQNSESTPPSRKKRRLSLSLKGKDKEEARFATISAEEIEGFKRKPTCKNTDKSQLWAFSVFQAWVNNQSQEDDTSHYDVSDLYSEDSERVCCMMCRFIVEARQRNGSTYCPKTLLQLGTNLQAYALKMNPNSCKFMDSKNQTFKSFHNTLNNTSKKLLSEGVGATKKQARIITFHEENLLWERGTIGTHTPVALLNAVFFYCGLYFCLRGGEEHRELKMSQLVIKDVTDPSDNTKVVECLEYTEHGSKNRKGLVHQVHLDNKVVYHYADGTKGEKCIVYLVKLYLSKLPDTAKEKDLFYCKPKSKVPVDGCWYDCVPVGRNMLSRKLNDMFVVTGLDCTDIHNHSLRATGISRLYNSGIPEKLIMERSGHLSVEGVRSYERTSELQRQQVSKVLSESSASTNIFNTTYSHGNSISKLVESSHENKENIFEMRDLHGCTFNFHFKS